MEVGATTLQAGATYHAITPTRVLDTRNGTGGLSGPFTNHVARTFTVAGVPAGATAVTGNLTVTGQTSSGYLYIGPAAANNPGSSTINFPVGDDRANEVTVQLGSGGTLSITFVAPSNGPTVHAIFDLTGYFTPDTTGATYHAITPTRALDTRNGTGGLSGPFTNSIVATRRWRFEVLAHDAPDAAVAAYAAAEKFVLVTHDRALARRCLGNAMPNLWLRTPEPRDAERIGETVPLIEEAFRSHAVRVTVTTRAVLTQ